MEHNEINFGHADERDANLARIKFLHRAMRWTAIGKCPDGMAHYTLGSLSKELLARIALEYHYKQYDKPAQQLMDMMIEKGKEIIRQKTEPPEGSGDPRLN